MQAKEFIKKIENLGLEDAKTFRVKKYWDGVPYYYNISGCNIENQDLVFHASPYGTLDIRKLFEDVKGLGLNGIVRVGSFKIQNLAPVHGGGMFLINPKKPKKMRNFFSFLSM